MTVNEISKAIEQYTLALLSSNLQSSSVSPNQPKLVLAYSGGVDSECLAYGLSAFAQQHPHIPCLLVHVHHGLSDNADTWVDHCLAQANKYQLPIQIERVNLTKSPRQSLEAIARDARYNVFKKYLNQGDILLTAHHQDDQLETVLLALKRGQGPKGLAAMGAIQPFNQHSWIVRPLLDISRAQIESFATSVELKHIEDESNQDEQFDRNFLRQDIIPRLKQRWPSIAVTASRSANLCAQQQIVIEQEVNNRLPAFIDITVGGKYPAFKLLELKSESPQWQSLLLRGYIQSQKLPLPSHSQLEQILDQVLNAADDAKVDVHCGDYSIKRFAGRAYIVPVANENSLKAQQTNTIDELSAFITGSGSEGANSLGVQEYQVTLSHDGVRLRLPNTEKVSVVFGAKGSTRCQPHFRDKGRELKKIWQELAVPPWQRNQTPLVFYNDNLVAALGLWVDKRFLAQGQNLGFKL
ncbi:tRNA lysidine(34) synthetase TilS [Shewanella olleyana]|uniref:tRNA lysidine(34) synthetase TilS n=1 Tax=Shewanella olleyana TaxID=135626 RepID=UPI00200FB850|nr:tRNA lysidine(34) synthetase TilS [Shewanella olleyana]MCL1067117.1 tRNA lysidine(34) synthetase TilS [Shewanella olleyana]